MRLEWVSLLLSLLVVLLLLLLLLLLLPLLLLPWERERALRLPLLLRRLPRTALSFSSSSAASLSFSALPIVDTALLSLSSAATASALSTTLPSSPSPPSSFAARISPTSATFSELHTFFTSLRCSEGTSSCGVKP